MVLVEPLQFLSLLSLGFALGLKHALDADHVAAVTTIVSETKSLKKSSLIGAVWGAGHTTALLFAGIAILIFKFTIPQNLALSLEFLVGIVLVLLGVNVIIKATKNKVHIHAHRHGKIFHAHFHSHRASFGHNHAHKPFVVGIIHGLAGSAALALLVLTAVNSVLQGFLYILVFGIGSILGMLLVSGAIGVPFLLAKKFNRFQNGVKIFAGIISVALGLTIIFEIVYLSGLL